MPKFKDFKGILPNKEVVNKVSSQSVDLYLQGELRDVIKNVPESFMNVIKPTFINSDLSMAKRFKKVRDNFEKHLKKGLLLSQEETAYYIYVQSDEFLSYKGVLGLIDLKDYKKGSIKIHENTLETREEMFAKYLKHTSFHAEPILMTYSGEKPIDDLIDKAIKQEDAAIDFVDKDGLRHQIWAIRNPYYISEFKAKFKEIPDFYLADGHHRIASSLRNKTRSKKKSKSKKVNYTLAYLVADHQLSIFDYNRLIRDLNGLSTSDFLKKLKTIYNITNLNKEAEFPKEKHYLTMYLGDDFYSLELKHIYKNNPKGLKDLDAYLLETLVLDPILNIKDSRNDKRLEYISGTADVKGVYKLKNKVDSGAFKVGFCVFPISFEDLKAVADNQETMPPKSTFIKPRLQSGLVIYDFKE